MAKGKRVAAQGGVEEVRSAVDGNLGEANLVDKGLSFGKKDHMGPVGKFDACWSKVSLNAVAGAGGGKVTVPHNLGRVPSFVTMMDMEVPEGVGTVPHFTVMPVERNKWTKTEARVDVYLVGAGSLTNVVAWFWVGG